MITEEQRKLFFDKSLLAGQIFNPNTPVSEKDLFLGRQVQITRVVDAIFQKGQHAIIFGERGVGKTSLSNVLADFIPHQNSRILSVRVGCTKNDSFSSVWRNLINEMALSKSKAKIGFQPATQPEPYSADRFFPNETVSVNEVRLALNEIADIFLPIIIVDEFDRLDGAVREQFADLIKTLSDSASIATVVLIGVGDSVIDILHDHESVSRALMQIHMPRMNRDEIKGILANGVAKIGMTIDEKVEEQISVLSKGLPHYAHLLGLHCVRYALGRMSLVIEEQDFNAAVQSAITNTIQSVVTTYNNAIRSTRKNNLFADVLLACALAPVNSLGEFAAQDVREPMRKITGKEYDIPAYAQHLNEFSESLRGEILIKSGPRRLTRYKFSDPIMQPFIIMQGIASGKIKSEDLSKYL